MPTPRAFPLGSCWVWAVGSPNISYSVEGHATESPQPFWEAEDTILYHTGLMLSSRQQYIRASQLIRESVNSNKITANSPGTKWGHGWNSNLLLIHPVNVRKHRAVSVMDTATIIIICCPLVIITQWSYKCHPNNRGSCLHRKYGISSSLGPGLPNICPHVLSLSVLKASE